MFYTPIKKADVKKATLKRVIARRKAHARKNMLANAISTIRAAANEVRSARNAVAVMGLVSRAAQAAGRAADALSDPDGRIRVRAQALNFARAMRRDYGAGPYERDDLNFISQQMLKLAVAAQSNAKSTVVESPDVLDGDVTVSHSETPKPGESQIIDSMPKAKAILTHQMRGKTLWG